MKSRVEAQRVRRIEVAIEDLVHTPDALLGAGQLEMPKARLPESPLDPG